MRSTWEGILAKIFDRFWLPSWTPRTTKIIKIQLVFICFFDFRCFQDKIYFGLHLGANMAPLWVPKSSKILPKIDPKRHQFFDRFLHRFFIDFCSFLEANLGPCWPHFRSKWRDAVKGPPLFCWVYVIIRF